MKVLITGIEGFVGPYLADLLLKKGHEVYGSFFTEIRKDNSYPIPTANVKKIHLDVTDKSETERVIKEICPEEIYHLAGFSSVKQSWDNPELCWKINVEGTKNLLDAVLAAGISPRILIVSSAEVYGTPRYLPIDEKHPLNPDNPYAKSRVAQEKLALEYVKKGIDAVIVRSFNHTGPGQLPVFVCSDFAHQITRIEKGLQEPVIKVGDLTVKRDFTDVRDIVRAYALALEKCDSGEIYNVCSETAYSIKEILDILLLSYKNHDKISIIKDHERIRETEIMILSGSRDKFTQKTDWRPEILFKNTLREIDGWWKKNP